jgi:hypothetical protein
LRCWQLLHRLAPYQDSKYNVNTFEQLVGRQIKRVLQLSTGEDFPPLPFPLAICLMLEEKSGLLVSFAFHNETVALSYMTLKDLQETHGTNTGENSLNELEQSHKLNQLVGQAIESIKVGVFKEDKLVSGDFVIKDDQYAGVILQTTRDNIVIYSTKEGGQILFDKATLPPGKRDWTLQ